MKRYIAAIAGLVLGLAVCLTVVGLTAAPANATVSFCKAVKGKPCIGPINGCSLSLGDNGYAFAENGDSIVNGAGIRMTCQNGKWVRAASGLRPEVQLGGLVGGGVFFQGPRAPIDTGCDVEISCPIG
jgi:hypothetical protein